VDTDDDGVREGTGEHAGEPLAFDIGPPIYDPVRCQAAELMSEWFAQIGVDATVQYMEWATLWGKITQPMDSPTKIDTWLLGSSQSVDPSWMHRRLHSANIPNPNYYGFMNATFDELALLQGTQYDIEERKESIWSMQEILAEEVPLIVLYFRQSPSVYRTDKLTGWIEHFSAGMNIFWNYINVCARAQKGKKELPPFLKGNRINIWPDEVEIPIDENSFVCHGWLGLSWKDLSKQEQNTYKETHGFNLYIDDEPVELKEWKKYYKTLGDYQDVMQFLFYIQFEPNSFAPGTYTFRGEHWNSTHTITRYVEVTFNP
jgi:hypothetical protein